MATTVREMQVQVTQRLTKYEDVGLIIESDALLGYMNRALDDLIIDIIKQEEKTKNVVDNILERLGSSRRFIRTSPELTPDTETNDVLAVDYLVSFSLPEDYLYYINSFSFLTRNESTGSYVENQLVDYMELGAHITTETNKPYIRRPKIALKEGDFLNVIHDYECEVTKLQIVYIRRPKKFSLDVDDDDFTTEVEINDQFVDEIISRTIFLYVQDHGTRDALIRVMNENLGNNPGALPVGAAANES